MREILRKKDEMRVDASIGESIRRSRKVEWVTVCGKKTHVASRSVSQ